MSLLVQKLNYALPVPMILSVPDYRDKGASLLISGMRVAISEREYVRLSSGEMTFFIGDHHFRAIGFLEEAKKAGIVSGDELFLHIDQQGHPDNAPLGGPGPELNNSNYVSRIARSFPGMERWFLHAGLNGERKFKLWGGAPFSFTGSFFDINNYKGSKTVVSLDLDLFDDIGRAVSSPQDRTKVAERVFRRLSEVIKTASLAMFFTSPGFTDQEVAAKNAQRLLIESSYR